MGLALSNELVLKSSAFDNRGEIPRAYTREGRDISPPLSWSGAPEQTRSFAVFCHDPDAPLVISGRYGFSHWTLYNIPASVSELSEGTQEYTVGENDFDQSGYGGPLPPEGHGVHHYFFWVLALDTDARFEGGMNLGQLLENVGPHVVAMNRLVGTYERVRNTP